MLRTGLRGDFFVGIPVVLGCGSALLHRALALFQIVTPVERAALVVCVLPVRLDIRVIISVWGRYQSRARRSAGTRLALPRHVLCSRNHGKRHH